MSVTGRIPGMLYAALQTCHPGGLPAWVNDATPRCSMAAGPLQLDAARAAQLADLVAAVLWECQQADGEGEPFTSAFAKACEAVLDDLAGR
ncbi:hypothetical protein [Streptomyces sp. RLB3-6]|uniref:hypothetical protein n=1 Tax=Streptomyces sp. RLB3-6 TaxID=2594457 RepID=UPI001165A958|nr:hypothetical protein [Streptomyces sp. RLB3-6]QDN84370.1 hypothetical protein FNV61_00130 [Streptomyces sp. RLB3-6]